MSPMNDLLPMQQSVLLESSDMELQPIDRARWLQQFTETIFVLCYAPAVLARIDEYETDTGLGPGMIAVEAVNCQPFAIELELKDPRFCRVRLVKVKAVREQEQSQQLELSTHYMVLQQRLD